MRCDCGTTVTQYEALVKVIIKVGVDRCINMMEQFVQAIVASCELSHDGAMVVGGHPTYEKRYPCFGT